jgi:hypothetical protein
VASRWAWRLPLVALISRSTSASVRYSRLRSPRLADALVQLFDFRWLARLRPDAISLGFAPCQQNAPLSNSCNQQRRRARDSPR